jgi:hypothetical protein
MSATETPPPADELKADTQNPNQPPPPTPTAAKAKFTPAVANGAELLLKLKQSGTGESKLNIGRELLRANPRCSAMAMYRHLAASHIVTNGTLEKARAFILTGEYTPPPPPAAGIPLEEALVEAIASGRLPVGAAATTNDELMELCGVVPAAAEVDPDAEAFELFEHAEAAKPSGGEPTPTITAPVEVPAPGKGQTPGVRPPGPVPPGAKKK